MAVAIQYYEPSIFIPETLKSTPMREIAAGAGHLTTAIVNRADIVIGTGSPLTLARAATNQATGIMGYAVCGEGDVFKSGTAPFNQTLFGVGQGSAIIPQNPSFVIVNPLQLLQLEINVSSTTGWQLGGTVSVDIGSTGGLLLDAVTNLFVFDPSQANKIMTIYSKPQGPNKGASGDTGARVVVIFSAASLI